MKRLTLSLVVALFIVSAVQGQSAYETYAAPLEIQIVDSDGNPIVADDTFTVGTQITVTCHVEASAYHSGAEYDNKAQLQCALRFMRETNILTRDDHNDEVIDVDSAEVDVDDTLSVTYTVQIPSEWYKIEAVANAYAMYWDPNGPIWREAEAAAASDTLTFEVEEPDTTPPVITLNGPAIMTLECGVDSYTELGATVSDDSDPEVTLVIGGDTVDTTTCGTYVVTYDATDSSGNAATQVIRTVIVQDTIDPVITCPDDFTVYVNPGETEAVVKFEVTATDDSGSVVVVCDPASGSTLPLGETEVNCTTTDEAGNQATCTFKITVESAESPEAEAIEHIIDVLEEMDVPEDAEKEMEKAVTELNKAIDEFNNDRIDKVFNNIAKAVKQLMKAQKEGANTQDVIDQLVELVQGIAGEAIKDAIEVAGEDNPHVIKAQKHYDKAFGNLADGKYDRAIKEFKKAYREAMKALGE